MTKAKKLNLPHADIIFKIQRLRREIGLIETKIEENIVSSYLIHKANCIVTLPEFALRLQVPVDNKHTVELFNIFDAVSTALRQYSQEN